MTRARVVSAISAITVAAGVVANARHVRPQEREIVAEQLRAAAALLAEIRDRIDARERAAGRENAE